MSIDYRIRAFIRKNELDGEEKEEKNEGIEFIMSGCRLRTALDDMNPISSETRTIKYNGYDGEEHEYEANIDIYELSQFFSYIETIRKKIGKQRKAIHEKKSSRDRAKSLEIYRALDEEIATDRDWLKELKAEKNNIEYFARGIDFYFSEVKNIYIHDFSSVIIEVETC